MAILRYRQNGRWTKVLGAVGVISFNGRSGEVTPQEGDYTPDMVGAAPAIVCGTEDVTAGAASPYPEGTLYVVLE